MNQLGEFLRNWGLIPEMSGGAFDKLKDKCMAQRIEWQENADAEYPFVATVDGKEWKLRINDFPAEEHVYTLFIDNKAAFSFSEMPATWKYPK